MGFAFFSRYLDYNLLEAITGSEQTISGNVFRHVMKLLEELEAEIGIRYIRE